MGRNGTGLTNVPRTLNRTRARRHWKRWERYLAKCPAPVPLTRGLARAWARYHIAERGRAPR
jgi:hypothetical protein